MLKKQFLIVTMGLFFIGKYCFAIEVPVYDFNMTAYNQKIENYLSPQSETYTYPLLSVPYQKTQLQGFYRHYYADDSQGLSPWSETYVMTILPKIYDQESRLLEQFNNISKPVSETHYAENFQAHNERWWGKINDNVNLEQFTATAFQSEHRAITVANTFARALPETAPDFYHFSLPGQGFPFDNLQDSALWVGTPLYVFHTSKDNAWSLVLTPDGYTSWVKSSDIAYVSPDFIQKWQSAAQNQLGAVVETEVSIRDKNHHFLYSTYIGAVFPLIEQNEEHAIILVPIKNRKHEAVIRKGFITSSSITHMPLSATPEHMTMILQQLQNRPYGWGGAFFFNDCSQEMKSIFTPFGIWLSRNSTQQMLSNPVEDLSELNTEERIAALQEKGHALMTLIYIGGHVMLYVGNQTIGDQTQAITYQNIWGMAPSTRDKRYVIGKSVFLPLLQYYPEHAEIMSLAGKSIFKLLYLDQLPA